MNVITPASAVALSLVLVSCGPSENKVTENRLSSGAPPGIKKATQIHSGTGIVTAVAANQVTLAHGAIESAGWPAMSMSFKSPTGVPQGVKAGTKVNFSFRKDDGGYVLTSIQPR